ncbi:MAG: peptidylprolyl isomerase [Limnospira sp.]
MTDSFRASVDLHEITDFLKREVKMKDVCHQIFYQKLVERASQERNITVTEDEIQAEADRQRRALRLEKASDTLAWLNDQMISPEDWEAGIRDRILAQKLSETLFSSEVEKYFAQNRLEFERVLLYQIVIPYERLARELLYQIEEEEISFYHAAHLYDIDSRRRTMCGYEGQLGRMNLPPQIAAVVFGAIPGELLGPISTEQGYHLLKVEEFIPAELTPECRQEILQRMFKNWLASELNYALSNASL